MSDPLMFPPGSTLIVRTYTWTEDGDIVHGPDELVEFLEFLLARIADDEEAWSGGLGLVTRPDFSKLSRHMLVECEAKRRIVELHAVGHPVGIAPDQRYDWQVDLTPRCAEDHAPYPCDTLRLLALPYADHPDFREEWRP